MKAIVCEMCGSQDLVKQDGMYVCQNCGTKYSPDDAKKLMVEVSGTVKVDNSQKIENYYQLARRAKASGNSKEAAKYYDLIRQENPSDWESSFFATYFAAMQTNIAGIANAAYSIANSAVSSIKLIVDNIEDNNAKVSACCDIADYVMNKASVPLMKATMEHYNKYSTATGALNEKTERAKAIALMLISLGDTIEAFFSDNFELCKNASSNAWSIAIIACNTASIIFPKDKEVYINKIKKYQPDYQPPVEKKSGCYVATAVYGSYDCPQVWTLRRYRDYTLAESWYGRAFIRIYYAISPTLVKWFGKTEWFKNLWKPRLDKMVETLNSDGVEDTPYSDRNW